MNIILTEEQFKEYIKYEITKNNLNEDWKSNLKGTALGLGLGAMTMGGMSSCQQQWMNEPDFPHTETLSKEHIPHEYPVGDNSGESAKSFKSFYEKCDWSNCGENDGYIYSISIASCKGSMKYLNVAKKNKRNGYYSYLMYYPKDAENLQQGDFVNSNYLNEKCELQVIYTVNCLDNEGNINIVVYNDEENCPYNSKTKFYNQFNDWEIGMKRVSDKWIANDKTYHFELMECVALQGKTYKIIPNIEVDKETYYQYDKGSIFNK